MSGCAWALSTASPVSSHIGAPSARAKRAEQLERSLRALGTDHVDLYLFHSSADEVFDTGELWAALNDQVQKGTVRWSSLASRSPTAFCRAGTGPSPGSRAPTTAVPNLTRRESRHVLRPR